MSSISFLGALGYLEIFLCITALCVLIGKKQWTDYAALGGFLAVRTASDIILTCLNKAAFHALDFKTAYHIYFYVYWISFAVESVLVLLIV